MKKDKLLASADSLDKIERLVNDYFFSISYSVNRVCDTNHIYTIYHCTDIVYDYYVQWKHFKRKDTGRYYFYKRGEK